MRQHYAHLFSSYATHPFSRWASIHSMKKQGAASVENQKLPDLFRFAGFQRAEHFKGSGKTRKRPIAGPYKANSGNPDKCTARVLTASRGLYEAFTEGEEKGTEKVFFLWMLDGFQEPPDLLTKKGE